MNQFENLHICYKHIEHEHVTCCRQNNNFWQNYGIFDLENFEVSFRHRVASLCK